MVADLSEQDYSALVFLSPIRIDCFVKHLCGFFHVFLPTFLLVFHQGRVKDISIFKLCLNIILKFHGFSMLGVWIIAVSLFCSVHIYMTGTHCSSLEIAPYIFCLEW